MTRYRTVRCHGPWLCTIINTPLRPYSNRAPRKCFRHARFTTFIMADRLSSPSRVRRTVAYTFPLLSILALYCMDIISMIRAPSPSASGMIAYPGGTVKILDKFHWLPVLDDIFRDVTVGFAPSAFEIDMVGWWQVFVFMADIGPMYFVMLMESSRASSKGWLTK